MKLLEVENITKKFPGVLALKNVNMSFERGKVHCILGENGAGKSTLVKIISGVFTPENGNIYINEDNMLDKRYLFDKVSYVPQEISLFNHMTVAENILLPFDKIENDSFFINQKKINTQVLPLLDTMNINLAPEKEVNEISVTERQLIQVARALSREDYEVIIFDEPTTSLDEKGKKSLFKIIERLKDKGNAIIYITHKVEELFLIGDEVTVLREGKKVGHSDISAIDQDWMIKKMSGKSIDDKVNYRPRGPFPKKILQVESLSGIKFSQINFDLYEGEILGFAGIVGSGRTEIMQSIFGYLPVYKGNILFDGRKWKFGDTSYSVRQGLFYLPEERKEYGIFPNLSVKNNIGLALMDSITSRGIILSNKEKSIVEDIIKTYDIKTPNLMKKISTLSGGNQQKAILGRTTALDPQVLIFDEPTKGIDIATKEDIYRIMKRLAEERNISIIFISSEIDELMRCTNRIITIHLGKKTGEFKTVDTDKEKIIEKITKTTRKEHIDNVSKK